MIEIQELLFFQTIAECGSFSAASAKLNYAQSNISTKIRQLEKRLGVPLFYRNNKGIELTEKGHIFFHYANHILQLTQEAENAVREDGTAHGSLAIGSLETIAHVHLPNLLAEYHRKYPSVQLSIHTATSAELVDSVLTRKIDAAFISGPITDTDLIAIPFTKEEMVLASSSSIQIQGIVNSTALVFAQGCYYRHLLEELFKEWNTVPKQMIEFNSTDAVLSSLCAGFGIALLPENLLKTCACSDITTMKIPEPYSIAQTHLIYRKDYFITVAFKCFCKCCNAYTDK